MTEVFLPLKMANGVYVTFKLKLFKIHYAAEKTRRCTRTAFVPVKKL